MLGLSSGLKGSSKLRGKYSAIFDGTGDYIDTGSAFQSTHRGSFSYSFWMKPDDGQPASLERFLGTVNSSDQDAFWVDLQTDGKINVRHEANSDPADYVTDAVVFPNGATNWTHITVAVTLPGSGNTSYKIFINGYEVAGTLTNAVAYDAHALWTSTDNVWIGSLNNDGSVNTTLNGLIDEFALFNVALSAAEVTAIYNSGKPFDLTTDLGDYDQASALVAYWRMFNGKHDDRVNGVIHDAHNPGFSVEKLTDGSFDNGLDNWTVTDNTDSDVSLSTDGGVGGSKAVQFTGDAANAYIDIRETILTSGKTYKAQLDVKYISGSGDAKLAIVGGSTAHNNKITLADSLVGSDFQSFTVYFVADGTSFQLKRQALASRVVIIDNISVVELNGYPGIVAADATYNRNNPHKQAMSTVMTLDGSGDYLNTGSTFQSTHRGSFSWSCWVKLDDGQPAADDTILGTSIGTDIMMINARTTGKIEFRFEGENDNASYETNAAVFSDGATDWTHITCTATYNAGGADTSFAIYVNGSVVAGTLTGSITDDNHLLWTTTHNIYLGGVNNTGTLNNAWAGNMDEVALWDVVLDADAVAAIYAAGRSYDLTADTGNYDNASDLTGYWRMGEGSNDDLTNGIIFDQNTSTIGSNLITESSFETTDDWTAVTASGSTSAVSTDIAHTGTKSWKVTVDGTDTNLGVTQDVTVELNTVYRADVWCYAHADNDAAIAMNMKKNAGNSIAFLGTGASYYSNSIPLGVWTLLTGYFRTASSNTALTFKVGQGGTSGAAGDIFYVDDVTLVKIGGNPGIAAANATFIRQPV